MDNSDSDFIIESAEPTPSDTSYGMNSTSLINPKPKNPEETTEDPSKKDMWTCRICFDDLHEPVVTLCGHIYCWTCIYTWYTTKNKSTLFVSKNEKIERNSKLIDSAKRREVPLSFVSLRGRNFQIDSDLYFC